MKPIPKPPWTKLGKKLESLCRKALYDYDLLQEKKIAIALSGGKDSLTLLYLLAAINGRGFEKFDLTCIHVSGEFSCGPAVTVPFLQTVCDQLGIQLIVTESKRKLEELECYRCSRERRRLLFEKAHENGIHTIAFGHHLDDNIQTGLLNLANKGEFAGMLPKIRMVAFKKTIIRPLIYVPEEQIVAFANHYGFSRITCQCPIGQNSKRKVVAEQLKSLERDFPYIRSNFAHALKIHGSTKAQKEED